MDCESGVEDYQISCMEHETGIVDSQHNVQSGTVIVPFMGSQSSSVNH